MTKAREVTSRVAADGKVAPVPAFLGPVPRRAVVEYFSFKDELIKLNQRIAELESKITQEKVIVIREITKEEAKEEIRQLFLSGRTLYYSDIVKELRLDLEAVVEICEELRGEKEIDIDAGVSSVR